jgi:hypothetical protein
MFGILTSAFNVVLGFVFRSIIVKFVLFFGLFFITTEFIQVLVSSGLLPTASSLNGVFGGIPAGVWYFLDLFNFSMGFSTGLAAFVTRFIIRRIPVIG